MNGFERRKHQKKESIKRAALQLFLRNGVEKVTIQEIVTEAKVSYATVFKYFGSKQDLVVEVVKYLYEQTYCELENILSSDKPYSDRIQEMMFHKTELYENVSVDLFKHASSYNPQEIASIDTLYEEKRKDLYQKFFQEGKDKGFIHPEVTVNSIILHRDALRALVLANPELLTEFKYNRDLLKGYLRILAFGIMGEGKLPDITTDS